MILLTKKEPANPQEMRKVKIMIELTLRLLNADTRKEEEENRLKKKK
jgi:hypothetical protein